MAIKTNAAKITSSDKKDIPSNYLPAGDSDNGVGYLISFAKKKNPSFRKEVWI